MAYNVSGGHFNPAVSVGMFVAEKKKENLVTLAVMVGAQFVGAFLGLLIGFLAVVDGKYQDIEAGEGYDVHANVPSDWVSFVAFLPLTA